MSDYLKLAREAREITHINVAAARVPALCDAIEALVAELAKHHPLTGRYINTASQVAHDQIQRRKDAEAKCEAQAAEIERLRRVETLHNDRQRRLGAIVSELRCWTEPHRAD